MMRGVWLDVDDREEAEEEEEVENEEENGLVNLESHRPRIHDAGRKQKLFSL